MRFSCKKINKSPLFLSFLCDLVTCLEPRSARNRPLARKTSETQQKPARAKIRELIIGGNE